MSEFGGAIQRRQYFTDYFILIKTCSRTPEGAKLAAGSDEFMRVCGNNFDETFYPISIVRVEANTSWRYHFSCGDFSDKVLSISDLLLTIKSNALHFFVLTLYAAKKMFKDLEKIASRSSRRSLRVAPKPTERLVMGPRVPRKSAAAASAVS
jgi:hypothetical protein